MTQSMKQALTVSNSQKQSIGEPPQALTGKSMGVFAQVGVGPQGPVVLCWVLTTPSQL